MQPNCDEGSNNATGVPTVTKDDHEATNVVGNNSSTVVVANGPVKTKVLKKRRRKKAIISHSDDDEQLDVIKNFRVASKIREERKRTKGDKNVEPESRIQTLEEKLLLGPYVLPEEESYSVVNPSVRSGAAGTTPGSEHNTLSIRPNVTYPQQNQLSSAPWVCALCGRGPSKSAVDTLGPLFGPYFVKAGWLDSSGANTSAAAVDEWIVYDASRVLSKNKKDTSRITREGEVWLHFDCVYWCPSVVFDGFTLSDMAESLHCAFQRTCASCNKIGSLLHCAFHNCNTTYHFPCAEESGCRMDPHSFTIFCSQHKNSKQCLQHFSSSTTTTAALSANSSTTAAAS